MDYVIIALDKGGAETMLAKLLKSINKELFQNEVIYLTGVGPIKMEFLDSGFNVTAVGICHKIIKELCSKFVIHTIMVLKGTIILIKSRTMRL